MSWSVSFVTKTKATAIERMKTLVGDNAIPGPIADLIVRQIDAIPEPTEGRAILVETNGHIDISPGYGYQNGDAKMRITLIELIGG